MNCVVTLGEWQQKFIPYHDKLGDIESGKTKIHRVAVDSVDSQFPNHIILERVLGSVKEAQPVKAKTPVVQRDRRKAVIISQSQVLRPQTDDGARSGEESGRQIII